ncbi:MAG: cell division protein FtsZ [Hyphomicrobiales bacterium]|jgi:cell division protein FtsZ|nr:cell division protein FtsZ [Hyphomicrobiales bacterium]
MTINLKMPDIRELKPRITVFGVGGAGGNAVNNMITAGLVGCDFVVANTDAQALTLSKAERIIQMGLQVTEGLGAGSQPDVGRAAAEEVIDEIRDHLAGAHMVFVTAGMGGGTGTGAAPIVAQCAKELGILTVGVVTKPFHFEGVRRMRVAEAGINELQKAVDTLLIIPNQNLFRVANEKTTFADAFAMADQVLYSGVACITDLMVKEGLINLDFADVRAVMREMGKAMMGTGEASGDKRALSAAEAAISNPLIDETSMKGAKGLLISITGGKDLTLYEVDEAATRIREEVDGDANIIVGATFDESLDGIVRVSVVATGIDIALSAAQPINTRQTIAPAIVPPQPAPQAIAAASRLAELTQSLRVSTQRMAERTTDQGHRAVAQALSVQPAGETNEQPQAEIAPAEPVHQQITAIEEVTIRPITPKPSLFREAIETPAEAPRQLAEPEKPFIPPQAEQPAVRAPRMPRIDELPMPAQNQIRARQAETAAAPEKPRVSLLQRLASVGLGRREEDAPQARQAPPQQAPAQRMAPPMPKAPPMPPLPRPQEPRSAEPVSEYAKRPAPQRPAPQGLDQHGRQAPVHNSLDDDQLEIPAFLRRQAN